MVAYMLEGLDISDGTEFRTKMSLSALFRCITKSDLNRIYFECFGNFVDYRLNPISDHRCARCTIGRDLGAVAGHVVTSYQDILKIVAGEDSDRR